MRRLRIPILILSTLLFMLLFFCDFLTGRQHLEFQDPYSRMGRIIERRYGISTESPLIPNVMTNYYYDELKQPRREFKWETAPNSYQIKFLTGEYVKDSSPIPSVIDLSPEQEVAFLRNLPNDKIRVAVIHSLYRERLPTNAPDAAKKNKEFVQQETDRVKLVKAWQRYDVVEKSPAQWWKENASSFGLNPEGEPLPPPSPTLNNTVEKK